MKAKRQKIRKSTKYAYIIGSIITIVIASFYLWKAFTSNTINSDKKEVYSYTQSFDCDYEVSLLNNKYIEEKVQNEGKAYVTDLMDNINMKLKYNYGASLSTDIKYTYEIVGVLQGVYTKNGKEQNVLKREYELKEKTEGKTKGSNVNISENLELDLKAANKLIREFEQEMSMDLDAQYSIEMRVTLNTIAEGQTVSEKYVSNVFIDIAEKTTEIDGKLKDSESKKIFKEVETKVEGNTFLEMLAIAAIVIALGFLKRALSLQTMNTIKNEYRIQLNRMLRICQDKIVQVNSKADINTDNIITVKDFGEIIKVSEELFKPILYWTSKEEEESWFCVMSHNSTYRYILKK